MPLLELSEAQVFGRLRFDNPWWVSKLVDAEYAQLNPRPYMKLFWPLIESSARRAVVVMGPRRVGKTVMMFHTITRLIEQGVDPLKIAFVSVETPLFMGMGLEQLFAMARQATGKPEAEGWYVLFDEIQYLKDWEVHLKRLVDDYPKTKFIASGSAAAALRMKSIESGAGRFTDFMLPPLNFSEYITLKQRDNLVKAPAAPRTAGSAGYYDTIDITELNREFVQYVNSGGYPEVTFDQSVAADPTRYLKNDIIEKVLLRDLPSLYGIRDVQELNAFFSMLAFNTGCEVSLEELSQRSGVEKSTMQRYIEYLEAAFLVKIVRPLTENARRFHRIRQFKVYLTTTSMRSALFGPMEPTSEIFGHLVESAIFGQFAQLGSTQLHYARWRDGEVDVVWMSNQMKVERALEIKWSNRAVGKLSEVRSLLKFCKLNGLDEATVTTLDKHAEITHEGIRLTFVPASLYALTVGRRTIEGE